MIGGMGGREQETGDRKQDLHTSIVIPADWNDGVRHFK